MPQFHHPKGSCVLPLCRQSPHPKPWLPQCVLSVVIVPVPERPVHGNMACSLLDLAECSLAHPRGRVLGLDPLVLPSGAYCTEEPDWLACPLLRGLPVSCRCDGDN